MYEADGIDLPKSQYDVLRHVESHGKKGDRGYESIYTPDVYEALQKRGLIGYYLHKDCDKVDEAWLEQPGRDWIQGYEAKLKGSKELRRHEWRVQFVNLGGGALLGMIASIITTLILHYRFGL